MAFCASCGRQTDAGAQFCAGCGSALGTPVAAYTEAPVSGSRSIPTHRRPDLPTPSPARSVGFDQAQFRRPSSSPPPPFARNEVLSASPQPGARLASVPRIRLPPEVGATLALFPGEVPAAWYPAQGGDVQVLVTNQRFLYRSAKIKGRAKGAAAWNGGPLEGIRDLTLVVRKRGGHIVIVMFVPIPVRRASTRYLVRVNGLEFDLGSEGAARAAVQQISRLRHLRALALGYAAPA
jgi:hypothetical protein